MPQNDATRFTLTRRLDETLLEIMAAPHIRDEFCRAAVKTNLKSRSFSVGFPAIAFTSGPRWANGIGKCSERSRGKCGEKSRLIKT
jgi:hypothetical protein